MEPVNPSSEECTEVCTKSIESQGQVLEDIAVLQNDVKHILRKLDDPHLCKWNGLIGQLIQFKEDTPSIRNNIFSRLDNSDTRINKMEDTMIELAKGRQVMDEIRKQQETNAEVARKERRNQRWAIAILIVSVVITFGFNVLLEYVKGLI